MVPTEEDGGVNVGDVETWVPPVVELEEFENQVYVAFPIPPAIVALSVSVGVF